MYDGLSPLLSSVLPQLTLLVNEVEQPAPIVALVDEVAELFPMATRDEKAQISEAGTNMIRVASWPRPGRASARGRAADRL
jgi:hypothetical protein